MERSSLLSLRFDENSKRLSRRVEPKPQEAVINEGAVVPAHATAALETSRCATTALRDRAAAIGIRPETVPRDTEPRLVVQKRLEEITQ
jgi:hypothetical protein